MNIVAFHLLYDNIHDFKSTAVYIESEITRLCIRSDSAESVPSVPGRKHRDMWMSLKTVSHYNLGTALELLLKLVLHLNHRPCQGHRLAKLYDEIPPKYQCQLEDVFQRIRSASADGLTLIAFRTSATRHPPAPPNRDMKCLRDFFEYLDEDLQWWVKRYSWESVNQGYWCHYLSDISVFTDLINHVMSGIERRSVAVAEG